jgi:predicted DNA repair protein MutK
MVVASVHPHNIVSMLMDDSYYINFRGVERVNHIVRKPLEKSSPDGTPNYRKSSGELLDAVPSCQYFLCKKGSQDWIYMVVPQNG